MKKIDTINIKNLHSYYLEIPSSIDRLSTVDLFLEKIQKIHRINEETFIKMDVILNEAVNNAIIHGNKLEPNKRVTINIDISNKDITIKITDEGLGFNPAYILQESFDENIHTIKERGLFIIKKLSSNLSFNKLGNAIIISINNDT
ncbi:MAG: ATP-binding protein [Solitalea-like symbiont of Acarus siro]